VDVVGLAAAGKGSAGTDAAADTASARVDQQAVVACSSSSSGDSSGIWLQGLNQQLQRAVLPTVKLAWQMAVGADMRFPTATSNEDVDKGPGQWVVAAYSDLLFKNAATHPVVSSAVYAGQQLRGIVLEALVT
jgi:hypothetical protein